VSLARANVRLLHWLSWVDVFLLLGVVLFIYGLIGVAGEWVGPYQATVQIDLGLKSLPGYAFFSLTRGFVAYGLSLIFTLIYGYTAAHSRLAERFLIPLLDILQSIPVLGFLPGLVIVLVQIFPNTNLGLELACILMIFTGQVWNMTFSFYSALRSVPLEMREMASIYRLNRLSVLKIIELPYSMGGLLWNSMLSMAGGWFFLMVVESFTLGDNNFRLPGIGSYMAVAFEHNNGVAITAGCLAMFFIIIVVDRVFWAPLVYWSHKFKLEAAPGSAGNKPLVMHWLERSNLLRYWFEMVEEVQRRREKKLLSMSEKKVVRKPTSRPGTKLVFSLLRVVLIVIGVAGFSWGGMSLYQMLSATNASVWLHLFQQTFWTFLRVMAAVTLGSLWMIPIGVFIGSHPVWTRRLQPVVQIFAAFPYPLLFPVVAYYFAVLDIGFGYGAVGLMILGSQWYILFNVIGGATLIPSHVVDLASVFQLRGFG